ncbi:hypothetical protein AAG906_018250 [Vitis piasezkii]
MKPLLSYDISGLVTEVKKDFRFLPKKNFYQLKSFWGETMRTTVDLINLCPSYPLEGDILERVWTGKFVSFEHLRMFGKRAFVHVPKDKRSKLDNKTKHCIFLVSPNFVGHNEHMEIVQKEHVDTVDRNDESAVDDVEENPTVENDSLK